MATVPWSDRLRNEIKRCLTRKEVDIQQRRDAALVTALSDSAVISAVIRAFVSPPEIYEAYTKLTEITHNELRNNILDRQFRKISAIRFSMDILPQYYEIPLQNDALIIPYSTSAYMINIESEWLIQNGFNEYVEQAVKIRNDYEYEFNDLETVRKTIDQVIKSTPSLNTALKVLPAIQQYIPQEYMTRVYQKTEKRRTKPPALELSDEQRLALVNVRLS